MVGKIILWILLGLLALLVIALLIPVRVRFKYGEEGLFLAVRYGPVKIQLLPVGEKKEKKEKPPKKEKPKKEKAQKPKKPKAKINREQILYAIEKLPPILGRALKRTGKSIHIDPLKLYILAAGPDPADTAQLYGRLEAALYAGFPVLEKTLRIKNSDVRLYVDFQQEQMDFIADVGVYVRPGSLVWMALRAAGSLIKWFIGFRKLASPPPELDENKLEQKSDADHEAA